jgi:hypothetical protein
MVVQENQAHKVLQGRLVQLDPTALTDILVQVVILVRQDHLVPLAHRVLQAVTEHQGLLVTTVPRVRQDRMVPMDIRVLKVPLVLPDP